MSEYKTFEELKEELGDKFEDYMYKANIELLNKLQQKENIIKEVRKYIMSELITEWDIKNGGCVSGSDLPAYAIIPILEILGRENNDK